MSKNRLDALKYFEKTAIEESRSTSLKEFEKIAVGDQHGIFQHFQSNVADYATRDRYLAQRGGDVVSRDRDGLYGVGPEHEDSYVPTEHVATHLSTRYSPDRVGVQAMRVSDGVFQDPYTNKVYDYNEGFSTEDGRSFPPGHAALQTSIMHLASHLDKKGLIKEATYLDVLLRKNAVTPAATSTIMTMMGGHPDAFTTGELMTLMQLKMNDMGLPPDSTPNNEVNDWSKRCAHKDNPCGDPIVEEFLRKQNAGEAMHSEPDDEDLAPWQKGQWARDRDALLESQKEEDPPFFSGEWATETAKDPKYQDAEGPAPAGIPDHFMSAWKHLSEEQKAAFGDYLLEGGPADASSKTSSHTIKNLVKLATHLDKKGFHKEATYIDVLLRKKA